jgi:hypothetical protein
VASTIGTVMGFGRVARGARAVTRSLPGSVPSAAASSKEVSPSTLN